MTINKRNLVYMAMLTALGVIFAPIVSIPVGAAKAYPVQHCINVICAVLMGPRAAVSVAFSIGLLRNISGTGTILAFPGGMVGALLAGYAYRFTRNTLAAAAGEVIGTGLFGALLAYPLVLMVLKQPAAVFAYVVPFGLSSLAGAIAGIGVVFFIRKTGIRVWHTDSGSHNSKRGTRNY
jgi:energy coupling factor transporter S component ThiW